MNTSKNFWKDKRVLITGHTGFKGSWLTAWMLLKGAKVYGYSLEPEFDKCIFNEIINDSFIERYKPLAFKSKIDDINNFNSLKTYIEEINPSIVFHLAAQPLVIESYRDPINTWNTNVIGSIKLLESLKSIKSKCAIVMVTTDKVYQNNEWFYGYRENDSLGGNDPYSASKAAMEIAISSWRNSYCYHFNNNNNLLIATVRAGNVIGGGDWSKDRIVPDTIRSLLNNETIYIRNPNAKRPWQHVLDPLSGYISLAENLYLSSQGSEYESPFNFGPSSKSNKTVKELVEEILKICPGNWRSKQNTNNPHEATLLHLVSDKAENLLKWKPVWSFEKSIEKTVQFYLKVKEGESMINCCLNDIKSFEDDACES